MADENERQWRKRAACRGTDPNMFFPETALEAAQAVAVCARCPVSGECYAAGIRNPTQNKGSIWGGVWLGHRRRGRPPVTV